jgi:hypothetical protein
MCTLYLLRYLTTVDKVLNVYMLFLCLPGLFSNIHWLGRA